VVGSNKLPDGIDTGKCMHLYRWGIIAKDWLSDQMKFDLLLEG
jgi:hypothetical protein